MKDIENEIAKLESDLVAMRWEYIRASENRKKCLALAGKWKHEKIEELQRKMETF